MDQVQFFFSKECLFDKLKCCFQFREETSPLLSIETLETRLSQIDRIIQRKVCNFPAGLD